MYVCVWKLAGQHPCPHDDCWVLTSIDRSIDRRTLLYLVLYSTLLLLLLLLFLGRAYLWGLSAGGKHGVQRTFQILKTELDRAMGLMGVGTIAELKERGPTIVKRRGSSPRDYPDRNAHERGYGGGFI